MKPADQGAGSRRAFLQRGSALMCLLAAGGCGGTPPVRGLSQSWLEPQFGFSGGRLTDRMDPNGFPLPGGNEKLVNFIFPVAVTAGTDSIFVADAGHMRLFRYVRGSGLMTAVPGIRVGHGTRLQSGSDGTIYLLDSLRGEIVRYSPYGQSLPSYHPRVPTSRYLDFAVDGLTGRIFAVDPVYRVVDQIEPMSRVAFIHIDLEAVGPVAINGDTLWVADPSCKCVSEWRQGRFTRKLAVGKIRLPKALAADRGEIYVLDGFDRSISRVSQDGLETVLPADIHLVSPEQFSVSGGMMYVVDGPGHTVAVFRIRRHHS